jgi:Rrf2 family protein
MILIEGACMRMSKRSEYGLKAAIRLATHHARTAKSRAGTPHAAHDVLDGPGISPLAGGPIGGGAYLQSREIADAERMPPKFLESVLLSLRSAQILVSKVGAGGGYRLSRAPELIRVHEVIDALERDDQPEDADAPQDAAGHRALDVLNRRLDDAVAGALGTLTLGDLIQMCDPVPARAN